jgi:hypothetical protein
MKTDFTNFLIVDILKKSSIPHVMAIATTTMSFTWYLTVIIGKIIDWLLKTTKSTDCNYLNPFLFFQLHEGIRNARY